ncbi:MAG TPA: DNA-3-methyladenine glycosylase 2 family protein [Phycisphaerales bacterium]|nr:DNA-3-methyladenine glycosylase 2 family protein [Phycisphaerales bacterium]
MRPSKELLFNKQSKEIIELSSADEYLAKLIYSIGDHSLRLRSKYFESLIRIIVGQQLSIHAARKIWENLKITCGEYTPKKILQRNVGDLKAAGLSTAKASYIHGLARQIVNHDLDLDELTLLEDEEVIRKLVEIKGIGKWSAEMYLIFSLGRLDVFSHDDVGLQRGIKWLYRLPAEPLQKTYIQIAEKWRPYRTIASLYIWEAINQGIINGNSFHES